MLASKIVEPDLQRETENMSVALELITLAIALKKTKNDLKNDFIFILRTREKINLNFLTHFHP